MQGCGLKRLDFLKRQPAPQPVAFDHSSAEAGAAGTDAADAGLGADADAGGPGFLSSEASCRRGSNDPKGFSAKELELQSQRRCTLRQARGKPAGGYLAVCLAVKGDEPEAQP